MANTRHTVHVLLVIAAFITQCVANPTDCTSGAACFPNGVVPAGLTDRDVAYYCCMEKNMTRHQNTLPDGTQNCTCLPDFTLDSQLQVWADGSMDEGRMCNFDEDCGGNDANSTVNYRFTYCCWEGDSSDIFLSLTTYDGDKAEYIGCRCDGQPLPTPDPTAYVVPSTGMYDSSGESCLYDKDCQDYPSLKCQSSSVSFCCYGSRGIVTANAGDHLTRCTCTNQVFGEHCEADPVPINVTMAHRRECTKGAACFPDGILPDGLTDKDAAYYCCLEKYMRGHQNTLPDGSQNCSCLPDFTLDEKIKNWADESMSQGRMCNRGEDCEDNHSVSTVNYRFKYCCGKDDSTASNMSVTIFDGGKVEYVGCRCGHLSLPIPDPAAYVVPPTVLYSSSGESCSYNSSCQDSPSLECRSSAVTFCCYGSRGLVTANDRDYFTRCTCTNEMFGEQCEANPISIQETIQLGPKECTMGAACFPSGSVPDNITEMDQAYYCCLEKNMTRLQNTLPDGTQDCICVPDSTLDLQILRWAQETRDKGRMCNREEDCEGSGSTVTVGSRFLYCCWKDGSSNSANVYWDLTPIDKDKVEYIGCRCFNQSLPSHDTAAYKVLPADMYPSSGESCSYDDDCQDHPSLKCQSSSVTFCCYGSRGIVTANAGDHLTRCTCTNHVFGEHCEASPASIKDTITHSQKCTAGVACFPNGELPPGITDRDPAYSCCLEENTTRQQNYFPNETLNCMCLPVSDLDSEIQRWAEESKDKGRMCNRDEDCEGNSVSITVGHRFKYCCWENSNSSSDTIPWSLQKIDEDKVQHIGCRCKRQPIPTQDPTAYIVPPTSMSSGESCSYDDDCQDHPSLKCQSSSVTFCCYGSRGIVTANDGDRLTRCTCTNEMFGEHCEANPVSMNETIMSCLTDCDDKADDEKCTDSNGNARCCPNNMAVVATVYQGNLATCACKAEGRTMCGGDTSSAARLVWNIFDVLAFVLTVLCLRLQ